MKSKLTLLLLTCFYFAAFAQWKPTNGLFSGEVHSVISSNNEIIVGTRYIYKSQDNGKTWFISNNGISGSVTAIRGLVKISTYIVAGTDAGVFYSTDNGNNWTASAGTASLNVWCVIAKGANLFLSTSSNGVYKSTTNGTTWGAVNTGITTPFLDMRSLVVKGTDLYAGSDGYGIFKSTTDGATWATVNTGLPGSYYAVSSLAVAGNNIVAGTYGAGVYKSTNNGGNWSAINNGVSPTDEIMAMGVNGNSVYASTILGSLFKTTDYINWNAVSVGTFTATRFEAFYSTGSTFYVGCWGMGGTEKSYGVFKTMDDGTSWNQIGITDYPVSVLEVSGNNVLAGTDDISGNSFRTSLYKTTEADTIWTFSIGGFDGRNITALKANGAVMYLFDDEGPGNSLVYRSTNNGLNWISTGYNVLYNNFNCFAIAGSIIYAGDNSAYYTSSHVFVSSDNGATWNVVNSGIPSSVHNVYGLALKGTLLFLATDNGIYKNTVGTNSWTGVSNGLTNTIIKSIYVSGTTLYAGTQGGGIFKSINDGGLWTDASTGLPLFANVSCFTSSGSNVFAGTDNGVFVTTSGGTNWSNINTGLIDTTITVLNASANYLWAGTNSQGVWRRDLSQIVVTVPATPDAISGSASICEGSPNTYSVSPVNGATSYTWTLPNGWSGTSYANSINTIAGSSGTVSVTANNSFGSSPAQTLNVTVNAINTLVTQSGFTLTANASGAAYVWIDCSNSTPVSGGNNQSYTVTVVGSYAVIVSQNGCIDTSACFLVDTLCHTSISGADLPYSGLSVLLSVDTSTNIPLGNPGVSQNWDYSLLTDNYNKYAVYNSTSSTAYASTFTASNIYTYGPAFMFGSLYGGAPVGTVDNGYAFWKSDSSGLWITGFRPDGGLCAGINVLENPKELLIGAPASYGSVFNNSARWELPMNQTLSNIDTFYVRITNKVITADACGSLTTPYGSYPNVLREHEHVITVDSVYMKMNGILVTAVEFRRDTLNNYIYLSNGIGYPACIVHADKYNAVQNAEYYSGTFTGINTPADHEPQFRLYPNPADGRITIEIRNGNDDDNLLSIYNSVGSLIGQKSTRYTVTSIDVSGFAKGIYFVRISNSSKVSTEKVVIQ